MKEEEYVLKINPISQHIEKYRNKLDNDILNWRKELKRSMEDLIVTNIANHTNLSKEKTTVCNALQELCLNINTISNELQIKQERLAELEDEEANLIVHIKNAVKTIEDLENMQQRRSKKENDIRQILRNCVKFAKTMTCTAFNYQTSNIAGVISTKSSCKVFDVNPTIAKEDAITDYMWQKLAEVSGEDWSDIFNDAVPN